MRLTEHEEEGVVDLMTRIAGIDGQSYNWFRSLGNPGKDW